MHQPTNVGRDGFQSGFQRRKCRDRRQNVASALLARADHDVLPAGEALFKFVTGKPSDGAGGRNKNDVGDAGFDGFFNNPVGFVVVDEGLDEREFDRAFFEGSRNGFHRDPGVFPFKCNGALRRMPCTVKNENRVACDRSENPAGVMTGGFGEVGAFSYLVERGLRRIKTGDGGHGGTRVNCNGRQSSAKGREGQLSAGESRLWCTGTRSTLCIGIRPTLYIGVVRRLKCKKNSMVWKKTRSAAKKDVKKPAGAGRTGAYFSDFRGAPLLQ